MAFWYFEVRSGNAQTHLVTVSRNINFLKVSVYKRKMDPPPPGNLVQRQGGLEAQRDLSTPPPPHSVKKSVPKIALNQAMHGAEHGYPISRTTVFTICFASFAWGSFSQKSQQNIPPCSNKSKKLAKFLQQVFSPVLLITQPVPRTFLFSV